MDIRTEGLGDFWHRIKGSRRRDAEPVAAPPGREPDEAGRACPAPRGNLRAIPLERATAAQQKRRNLIEVEKLADSFIPALRPGNYAYRALKQDFDGLCEECGLDPISDQRFGTRLRAAGLHRYRTEREHVTMYAVLARAAGTRLAA